MGASSDVKPTKLIGQLLNHAGITQVICVDDEYASYPSVEVVIGLYNNCSAEDRRATIADLDIAAEDPDVVAAELRRLWATTDFDDERKKALHTKLKAFEPDDNKVDTQAASMLSRVMQGQALSEISFREWNERKERILARRRKGKTLLLFDLDMSNDGGSPESGIGLIREVLAKTRTRFTCGLLSHTISSNGEHKAWSDLSAKHSLDQDRFIPISKSRLQQEGDLFGFANGIRRVLLNPQMKRLRADVAKVIAKAQNDALKAVEGIDIFDLERIVFGSSMEEGVWEPDTLFRLFGLYHRVNARKAYLADANLHALASRVRVLSAMAPNRPASPNRMAWQMQQLELYEDPEMVNRSHLPIELGDIFEKTGTDRRFILLAQPCDLMVRKSGSRHHTVLEGVLAEVVKDPPKNARPEMLAELQFYDSKRKWSVHLKKVHTVALSMLDLCVFQADGVARIDTGAACPECVIPTWQKYHAGLCRDYLKLVSKYEALLAKGIGKQEIEKALLRSSTDGLFKGAVDIAKKMVSYDCKRIGRLCRSHSQALLTRYAHHIARAAFEHYFDKVGGD